MKISPKAVAAYGYMMIAVMLAMIVLIWLRQVPVSWYMTMFYIGLVLFLLRITLRLLLARQQRIENREREQGERTSS